MHGHFLPMHTFSGGMDSVECSTGMEWNSGMTINKRFEGVGNEERREGGGQISHACTLHGTVSFT